MEDKILIVLYKHLMIRLAKLMDARPPFITSREEDQMSAKALSSDGLTLFEIEEHLRTDLKEGLILEPYLIEMESKHLIEKRHFHDGLVDYALDNDGIKKAVTLLKLK